MTRLTLSVADDIKDAAVGAATAMAVPMAVAVCDAGGHMLTFCRMDDCILLAVETVQAKARTAVYFRRPTADTVERSLQHPTVYTTFAEVSTAPIVMSMGGLPLWSNAGKLVGAVAAAGGTGEEDVGVAEAGARVWAEVIAST